MGLLVKKTKTNLQDNTSYKYFALKSMVYPFSFLLLLLLLLLIFFPSYPYQTVDEGPPDPWHVQHHH